jgi:hypothetical protein
VEGLRVLAGAGGKAEAMRSIVIALALLASSAASASECYSVRDMDKRLACLAEERRSPEGCTSIRNPDQRIICRQRAGERDAFGERRSERRW